MFGTARIQIALIVLAALAGTHVVAYYTGWLNGAASERAAWTLEKERVLAQASVEAEKLRSEGKELASLLMQAEAKVRVEYVEKIVTIKEKASAVRTCFRPSVTDALNRQPIRETVVRPGEPPTVIEHKVQVEGGTSELAAAVWVAGAQAAHEQCRAQIGALAAWIAAATRSRP